MEQWPTKIIPLFNGHGRAEHESGREKERTSSLPAMPGGIRQICKI